MDERSKKSFHDLKNVGNNDYRKLQRKNQYKRNWDRIKTQ